MFIGFLTAGQLGDLKTTLKWAKEHGFKSISIAAWPDKKFFDVKEAINRPSEVKKLTEETGIIISAIGFYGNPISPEESVRKHHQEHFMNLIEAAYKLEIPVVTGWIGKISESEEENYKAIEKEWPKIIRYAEDRGVKIAIENCPGNIMYRPDIWEKVFEILGSKIIGLEFDPSHLICQFIDVIEVADKFGDRIYHTHMKDAQILWNKVRYYGIRSRGWCPHRLPGFGDLDWAQFISILKKHGYDYALSIEHEDPYFKYEEGLILARKFLERFIV